MEHLKTTFCQVTRNCQIGIFRVKEPAGSKAIESREATKKAIQKQGLSLMIPIAPPFANSIPMQLRCMVFFKPNIW